MGTSRFRQDTNVEHGALRLVGHSEALDSSSIHLTQRGAGVINIAIVDDHPIARRGVEDILRGARDLTLVASVASAAEVTAGLTTRCRPDVVMMDLYLDGGVPALSAITELAKNTQVLVMSASCRPADVVDAIRAGACGYLTKHSAPELFVTAVSAVAAGGFLLSAELAKGLFAALCGGKGDPGAPDSGGAEIAGLTGSPRLSPREEQTLDYVAQGFTHSQIATRLGVRTTTVDTYVERIRAKLQVGNKAELALAAVARLDSQRKTWFPPSLSDRRDG
jgi:two-component system nitrate/nitrite response regulator NarL